MELGFNGADKGNRKVFALLGSLVLVLLIIYADYLSGLVVHLTALLLIPVYFASRYSGFLGGLLISVLSSLSLLIDPILDRKIYPRLWEVFWNIVVLFIFFILFTYLLTRLDRELERTRQMARTDNLTGLLNARAFFEAAEAERVRAVRHGGPFTLCFLDLDDFKRINDNLGHMTGDELLRITARALRESVRAADFAVRLGGDEFAVLFPETGPEAAQPLAARLHSAVNHAVHQRGWAVTPSLGVVTFYEAPGSVNDMLHQADQMMYEAKRQGKNRIQARTVGLRPDEEGRA